MYSVKNNNSQVNEYSNRRQFFKEQVCNKNIALVIEIQSLKSFFSI